MNDPLIGQRSVLRTSGIRRQRIHLVLDILTYAVCAVLSVLLFIYMHTILTQDLHLDVYANGTRLGLIDSAEDLKTAIRRLDDQYSAGSAYGIDYQFGYTFVSGNPNGETVMDADDCFVSLFNYTNHYYTEAYELSVGGNKIACLRNPEDVSYIQDRLSIELAKLLQDSDSDITDVRLLGSFATQKVLCNRRELSDADTVCSLLLSFYCTVLGTEPENPSLSLPQDTPEDAGNRLSAYTDENAYYLLLKGNGDILHGTSSVTEITDSTSTLLGALSDTYKTYKNITETKILPYDTITVESDKYYVGTVITEIPGETGVSETVYRVEYLAGEETARTVVSETILSAPVACHQIVGTKEYPKPIPTGTYIWPLQTIYITSYFGWRPDPFTGEYRYHYGLDLYEPRGSAIFASDGGTVIEAGYNDSYGIYVLIDHGDNLWTRYAHMEERMVSVGDNVYQGQQIGKVGATGRASGYHCHFEIILNDNVVDPLKYLPN